MRWRLYGAVKEDEYHATVARDVDLPQIATEMYKALGHADRAILSYVDDPYSFEIPHKFWSAIHTDGLALSFYVSEGLWSKGASAPDSDKYAVWQLGRKILFMGSDLNESTRRAIARLREIHPSPGIVVDLVRFSRSGQFNLYIDYLAIQVLASYDASLRSSADAR